MASRHIEADIGILLCGSEGLHWREAGAGVLQSPGRLCACGLLFIPASPYRLTGLGMRFQEGPGATWLWCFRSVTSDYIARVPGKSDCWVYLLPQHHTRNLLAQVRRRNGIQNLDASTAASMNRFLPFKYALGYLKVRTHHPAYTR
jgi:hypothetical protein